MNFYHKLPVQIRFNDIDMANHVNNAVYQEYCDLSRYGYFLQVIGETEVVRKLGLVIASMKIDFFRPVFISDRIHVLTKVIAIGNKSIEVLQHVVREGESDPVSVCHTTMVCYNYMKQIPEMVPESWRKKISEFEKGETGDKRSS